LCGEALSRIRRRQYRAGTNAILVAGGVFVWQRDRGTTRSSWGDIEFGVLPVYVLKPGISALKNGRASFGYADTWTYVDITMLLFNTPLTWRNWVVYGLGRIVRSGPPRRGSATPEARRTVMTRVCRLGWFCRDKRPNHGITSLSNDANIL
jgi:hypothetical protein